VYTKQKADVKDSLTVDNPSKGAIMGELHWPGERCDRCKNRIVVGFDITDGDWDAVTRHTNYDILCLACFDELAQIRGVHYEMKTTDLQPPLTWHDWNLPGVNNEVVELPSELRSITRKTLGNDYPRPHDKCGPWSVNEKGYLCYNYNPVLFGGQEQLFVCAYLVTALYDSGKTQEAEFVHRWGTARLSRCYWKYS
jgi:hypothetical protein